MGDNERKNRKDCDNCFWGCDIDDNQNCWCDEREEYVRWNYYCPKWKEKK